MRDQQTQARSGPGAAPVAVGTVDLEQHVFQRDHQRPARPLGTSGDVIRIDMHPALKIGAACGSDLTMLSQLLPAAEAGLVEALCNDRVRDRGP